MFVEPGNGLYRVFVSRGYYADEFIVTRTGACTCGAKYPNMCEHIEAVKEHVESGGAKARRIHPVVVERYTQVPDVCPICTGEVTLLRPYRCKRIYWECVADKSHYWLANWGDKVRAFLTDRQHFNKLGPFYEKEIVSES